MNLTIEQIAEITHDINREYCKQIGDDSQPYWGFAPEWQKESAIQGVKEIIERKTKTFEDQHNSWMKWKFDRGWKYGALKDPEKKEHPCLVPYSKLELKHKIKDELFRNTVKALLPLLEDDK